MRAKITKFNWLMLTRRRRQRALLQRDEGRVRLGVSGDSAPYANGAVTSDVNDARGKKRRAEMHEEQSCWRGDHNSED